MKNVWKRLAAALLCGVLLLPFSACGNDSSKAEESMGVSSSADSGVQGEKLPLTDLTVIPENTYSEATLVCDSIVVEAGSKKIPYRVLLYNNPGFGFVGLRLSYEDPLTPYMDEEKGKDEMEVTLGTAMNGFMVSCMNSPQQKLIGAAGFAGSDCEFDGAMFTCYFDIPADAPSGTVYDFSLEVVDFRPMDGENHEVKTVKGSITVQ
ncbi:MAG: hypothetical protein IJC75_02660 [Oscillospiraceae bacterium]|nr:hypothetical protein [Ruminococcus sp.]MBQ4346018.1 hypothetical protein [Oscillospiraceae bacterium]